MENSIGSQMLAAIPASTSPVGNLATSLGAFAVKPLADASKVELQEDQFLVRYIRKNGEESKGVVCAKVSEEAIVLALENPTIYAAMLEWYESQAAEACKVRIAAGASSICLADYSPESIAEMLAAREISEGRISAKKLQEWFASELAPVLAAGIREAAQRSGLAEVAADKMAAMLDNYKAQFALLAKREYSYGENAHAAMGKALGLLEANAARIGNKNLLGYARGKLAAMAPKQADDFGL